MIPEGVVLMVLLEKRGLLGILASLVLMVTLVPQDLEEREVCKDQMEMMVVMEVKAPEDLPVSCVVMILAG